MSNAKMKSLNILLGEEGGGQNKLHSEVENYFFKKKSMCSPVNVTDVRNWQA